MTNPDGTRRPAGRRADRRLREREHDPYRARSKPTEPSLCPQCGACFREGRWTWTAAAFDAPLVLCPACRRIRDRYPGGTLELQGPFARAHREEILRLARHVEAREKAEHPLQRIIEMEDAGETVTVLTTDAHLARAIGEALHHAYRGELEFHYTEEEDHLRVRWAR